MSGSLRAALLLSFLGGGCISPSAFPCDANDQCDARGPGGICEPDGFCSYPDDDCASGRRFESRAPGALGGACVSVSESSSSTGPEACGGNAQPCCDDGGCDPNAMCFGQACGCVAEVFAGDFHNCWVRVDGRFECWGGNAEQELGRDRDDQRIDEPAPVVGLPDPFVFFAAAARSHTCVLGLGGQVYCWGQNEDGQADPDTAPTDVRTARRIELDDTPLAPAEVLGLGPRHTCVAGERELLCWGVLDATILGWPDIETPTTVDVDGVAGDIVEIAGGGAHTCVLTHVGRAYCWGYDFVGQLGLGMGDQSSAEPTEVPLTGAFGDFVTTISVSDLHSCAVVGSQSDENGEVVCWGGNEFGQSGGPVTEFIESPTVVPGIEGRRAYTVTTGPSHTCAVLDDGVFCWGDNVYGRVNPFAETDGVLEPQLVPALDPDGFVLGASAGFLHSCGLTTAGEIQCWGCGGIGQLGPDHPAVFCEPAGAAATLASSCE